jgi:hypothetical protein
MEQKGGVPFVPFVSIFCYFHIFSHFFVAIKLIMLRCLSPNVWHYVTFGSFINLSVKKIVATWTQNILATICLPQHYEHGPLDIATPTHFQSSSSCLGIVFGQYNVEVPRMTMVHKQIRCFSMSFLPMHPPHT